MTTMRFFQRQAGRYVGMLVFLALTILAGRANATYRADFFDISRRPAVTFDKAHLTWTLRNGGVERTIHFDAKAGSLQTLGLRDLHTHHVLTPAPDGEGEITFASPLLQTPVPLAGWKYTDAEPGGAWMQPGYDDKSWKKTGGLPPVGGANTPFYWYRAVVPAGRLKTGHAYALYLPETFDMEVYADGVLLQKLSPSLSGSGRPAQIDLPVGCRVLGIETHVSTPIAAYTAEVGTSPPALNLAGGWQYMMYTVNAGEDNSRVLTVRLSGVKQYEGFELDVNYQIHAGEEPTIAKWFSFVSHRKTRFLMETVTYDRWQLFPALPQLEAPRAASVKQLYAPTIVTAWASDDMLMTAQFAIPAFAPRSADGKELVPNAALNIALKPELPCATPKSITAFWHGPAGAGAFLHQLYLGQYVARGNPTSVPVAYNTRYAYGDNITAATCAQIIPLAASLGVQAFVLDDGWQSNITPDTGRYGDWMTDKEKFPKGLLPLSTLARENHLRFGLFVDATRVNARSQAASAHPDWLFKPLPTGNEGEENDTGVNAGMCFTGAWARQFTQSIASLCREQSVSYLKTRFLPLEKCMATTHEHPTGHSAEATREAWENFCDALYGVDKTMAVVESANSNRLLEAQDSVAHYNWPLEQTASGASKRVDMWLQGMGAFWDRYALEGGGSIDSAAESSFNLPSFVQNGQAICHLPTADRPTREQLKYLWSGAATLCCNIEVQGDLERMTPDEREIGKKWIAWNLQNRDWLAFTQPLTLASSPAPKAAPSKADTTRSGDQNPPVRGLLHLRNALNGRYGYVCLWNTSNVETTVIPSFNPSDYFVRMKTGEMSITNIQDNSSVPFSTRGSAVSLGKITLPAYGWAVYELRAK